MLPLVKKKCRSRPLWPWSTVIGLCLFNLIRKFYSATRGCARNEHSIFSSMYRMTFTKWFSIRIVLFLYPKSHAKTVKIHFNKTRNQALSVVAYPRRDKRVAFDNRVIILLLIKTAPRRGCLRPKDSWFFLKLIDTGLESSFFPKR